MHHNILVGGRDGGSGGGDTFPRAGQENMYPLSCPSTIIYITWLPHHNIHFLAQQENITLLWAWKEYTHILLLSLHQNIRRLILHIHVYSTTYTKCTVTQALPWHTLILMWGHAWKQNELNISISYFLPLWLYTHNIVPTPLTAASYTTSSHSHFPRTPRAKQTLVSNWTSPGVAK